MTQSIVSVTEFLLHVAGLVGAVAFAGLTLFGVFLLIIAARWVWQENFGHRNDRSNP